MFSSVPSQTHRVRVLRVFTSQRTLPAGLRGRNTGTVILSAVKNPVDRRQKLAQNLLRNVLVVENLS